MHSNARMKTKLCVFSLRVNWQNYDGDSDKKSFTWCAGNCFKNSKNHSLEEDTLIKLICFSECTLGKPQKDD